MINAFFLGTLIPLLLMILLLKKESRMIMSFFAWGLVAFVLSYYVNTALGAATGLTAQELSVSWAPIVEEFFKALPLLLFMGKRGTKQPLFYFAMAAGIGFAIQENYLYLMSFNDSLPYIITRSVTTCLMHGMTTATIGLGLSYIVRGRLHSSPVPILFGLFTFAVIFHALYNLYINSSAKLLGLLMAPALYVIEYMVYHSSKEKPETADSQPEP